MHDVKAASIVFWASFFINQRGCDKRAISPLFQQLTSSNAFLQQLPKDQMEQFTTIWFPSVHDYFLENLTQAYMEICNEWLNSPAGRQYESDILHARYCSLSSRLLISRQKRKCAPKLQDKSLLNYTSDVDKTVYQGIDLASGRVWNFYQPVIELLRPDIVHYSEPEVAYYDTSLTLGV